MKPQVTIVDYGMGNLFSICNALDHCGAKITLSSDSLVIAKAEHLILPGVGAFKDGMAELSSRSLIGPIKQHALTGRPFLGICLGMQMMLEQSSEFGVHEGLGLIKGSVVPIPPTGANGDPHKIPHIGWNSLLPAAGGNTWATPLLEDIPIGTDTYFVHSFMAKPENSKRKLALCYYNGIEICGAIGSANLLGCQFHPEKSGEKGLQILTNFLRM